MSVSLRVVLIILGVFLVSVRVECFIRLSVQCLGGSLHSRLRHSVGIDLGTTFSLVSVLENARPKLLTVDGSQLIPSIVSFSSSGEVFAGQRALDRVLTDPRNTFSSFKRLIGRSLKDVESTGDLSQFGNKVLRDEHDSTTNQNFVTLQCPNLKRTVSPVELSSELLRHMLCAASKHFEGEPITNAVITVPAYFNMYQREATLAAATAVGLKKTKLLAEPEAAAFAYGLDKRQPQLVLVIDLGGGTFDVSVLSVGDGVAEVVASSGDSHLGGDDFDQLLCEFVYQQLEKSSPEGVAIVQAIRSDHRRQRQLRALCVQAKIALTTAPVANISLSSLSDKSERFSFLQNHIVTITRSKFHELAKPLLLRLLRPLREVALMAGVNLPGESGLLSIEEPPLQNDSMDPMPEEQDTAEPREDLAVQSLADMSLSDEDCSVLGNNLMRNLRDKQLTGRARARARHQAEGSVGKELRRLQRLSSHNSETQHRLHRFPGGREINEVVLVGGATRMRCILSLVRTLTQRTPRRHIHPDRAVCLGAGVLAGVLDGVIADLHIVNPFQAALLRLMAEHPHET